MGTSVSFVLARKIAACLVAASLSLTLVPAFALAEDGHSGAEGSEGAYRSEVPTSPQPLSDLSTEASSSDVTLSGAVGDGGVEGSNEKPLILASGLAGKPANFINSDVILDSTPIVGSFTTDGLTYAVIDGPYVELVGIASSNAAVLDDGTLAIPETVSYEGVSHIVSSIAPYAFYLSGVASATLPASVSDVDERAFRSSDVESVTVAEGNPFFSSFDGVLYDVDKLSLLLIPEGKQGAVVLPKEAETVPPSSFSHCSLVDTVSVEDGSAAFASENGLLYSSDLTTLLRVPAGATEITIREGCTTIAAGALEACAKLTTINAPATVTSISPDIFHAIPTVSLPAASVILGESGDTAGAEGPNEGQASEAGTQLTAMVALSSADSDLPEVDSADIEISFPEDTDIVAWKHVFSRFSSAGDTLDQATDAMLSSASSYAAIPFGMFCTTGGYIKTCSYKSNANVSTTRATASTGGSRVDCKISGTSCSMIGNNSSGTGFTVVVAPYAGYAFAGWNYDGSDAVAFTSRTWSITSSAGTDVYAVFRGKPYTVTLQDGDASSQIGVVYGFDMPAIEAPKKPGYSFAGYFSQPDGQGTQYYLGEDDGAGSAHTWDVAGNATIYAYWTVGDHDLGFDTSSEPGDEDYQGEEKPDQTIVGEQIEAGEKVEIEDPKRPGYVFQGWTIPNAEGTEAIDQDLVYQDETDGKWYVDASKLPDYAGDDGRVELTARWTSVISVDVPSSVTFYADVVTQGNESREGLASSAFGQSKVQSQSEVDLRIVGLESKQVKGNGSTSLGASDILKKKDGSTVSGTADKLLSLYPATGELTEDDLKDPDATSASKPAGAVDFSLDDILLEKSFAADEFTIPAGGALSLGYRLNLQETSTELDYDKLSALDEGTSASIANISYCFAADGLTPADWREPLWIEDPQGAGFLLLSDIKGAALDLSSHATNTTESSYYQLYKGLLDSNASFHLLVGDSYHDVHIIGICQDVLTDGGKAGLTFEMKNVCDTQVVPASGRYGYNGSNLQTYLEGDFYGSLDARMRDERVGIAGVTKRHQVNNSMTLQTAVYQHVFVPSFYEIFGVTRTSGGWNNAENSSNSFQYQHFAKGGANTNASSYRVKRDAGGTARIWVGRSAQYDSNLTTRISGAFSDGSMSRVSTTSKAYFAPCFAL